MPVVSSPTAGDFCWVELQTTDADAARDFYGEVFGWAFTEKPAPAPYAVATIDGVMTAGITPLSPQARSMGAPPHWLSYVAVDDVAASSATAATLGGRILVPPTAMGPGTFAVIADPTGGVLALWHSPESMGGVLSGEPSSLGWNELVSTDPAAAEPFYTGLFSWTCEHANMPGMVYSVFKRAGEAVAGLMPMPKGEPAGARSHWNVYFAVEDADQTVDDALARGATALTPLMDVPNTGRLGFLADPQGVTFAVICFEGLAS